MCTQYHTRLSPLTAVKCVVTGIEGMGDGYKGDQQERRMEDDR